MGDVNCLKIINDGFGHIQGDKLLQNVALTLKNACHGIGSVARWGGDEFIMLLPKTNEEKMKEICAKIQNILCDLDKDPITSCIALGMTSKTIPAQNIESVIMLAEDKMYTNKIFNEKKVRNNILLTLQNRLAKRSYESKEHTKRIQNLAMKIGSYLSLPERELDLLTQLAFIHDIGKVAIPEYILKKQDTLSEKEWEEIKKHPEVGYRIARSIPELAMIAEAIRAHHEWWNGEGYPLGLKGEEIPFISRIISIIDAYDVMVFSDRSYRKKMNQKQALDELRVCAGNQFDPELVDAFCNMVLRQKVK